MNAPRVGVVGGARRRQGLGPFDVRDLVANGAAVPAFVTTNAASCDATRTRFEVDPGIVSRGYLDLAEMLASERLDALAILSPAETHGAYLDIALAAGLPVLCEKPLIWGGDDLGGRARMVVDAFEAASVPLWENCQWPYTLEAFERLYPGALDVPPEEFEMLMQPASSGVQAFGDSLPHTLSLLQTLVPGPRAHLAQIVFTAHHPRSRAAEVAFEYRTDLRHTRVRVRLVPSATSPRAAAYALDGKRADRRVTGNDYQLSFVGESGRSVPLEDPLTQLVADFVAMLRSGVLRTQRAGIAERMSLLGQLVDAYREQERNGLGGAER